MVLLDLPRAASATSRSSKVAPLAAIRLCDLLLPRFAEQVQGQRLARAAHTSMIGKRRGCHLEIGKLV